MKNIWLVIMALMLAGCAAGGAGMAPTETPAPEPTRTFSPTPTIDWFPATQTPTPRPTLTRTPEPDIHPGIGELVLQDNFTDMTLWLKGSFAAGNIAFGEKSLTLAVAQPAGYLISTRTGTELTDYYAELTALPTLCKPEDQFGMVFRATEQKQYYRFVVNCNAAVRLERIRTGEAIVMQDWMETGLFPPGGNQPVRLGIWVLGKQMRFSINGSYLFSASDPLFTGGSVGVFARSMGENPLTVSFSGLEVFRVAAAQPPTLTPTP